MQDRSVINSLGFMGGFFSLVLGWPSKLILRIDASHLATAMARGGMCYDPPQTNYLQILAYTVENCTATTPAKSNICCSVKSSVANSAALPRMSDAVIVAAS